MRKKGNHMNTMDLFHILYIVFLIFGGLLLVAAIFEFFAFNIKKIFQDLAGITRKREIRHMTENTEYTGQLRHHSAFKKNGTIVTPSGKLKDDKAGTKTGKIYNASKKAVITPPPANYSPEKQYSETGTEILNDANITAKIHTDNGEEPPQTGVLNQNVYNTAVLNQADREAQEREEQTTILSDNKKVKAADIHFLLERQILITHTDEVIEG